MGCITDNDCPEGTVCTTGQCVPINGSTGTSTYLSGTGTSTYSTGGSIVGTQYTTMIGGQSITTTPGTSYSSGTWIPGELAAVEQRKRESIDILSELYNFCPHFTLRIYANDTDFVISTVFKINNETYTCNYSSEDKAGHERILALLASEDSVSKEMAIALLIKDDLKGAVLFLLHTKMEKSLNSSYGTEQHLLRLVELYKMYDISNEDIIEYYKTKDL